MTREKVLEMMPSEYYEPLWIHDIWAMTAVALIWVILLSKALPYLRRELGNDESETKYVPISILAILIPFIVLVLQLGTLVYQMGAHSYDKRDWQQEYVDVYMEQLPEIKVDVVNKMDMGNNNKHAKVIFGRDAAVMDEYVAIVLDLESSEEPYVTYRELDENIGWVKAGYHYHKLHLPKDYKF